MCGCAGTPWAVAMLPNGDLLVGCGQAGTSRRGHVYVFTTDESRACKDDLILSAFQNDCKPPEKSSGACSQPHD
ncbi:hypothetical protein EON66_01885 [archaeon]|nr:MAG: hypothetical protein EON66_01885 [archaeon]